MNRLLAATDFSAPSRHAVDSACQLAGELSSPLTLVHALQPGIFAQLQAMLGSAAPSLDLGPASEIGAHLRTKTLLD